jgi:hypothetical protein
MSAKAAERVKQIVDELLTTRIADLADRVHTQRRLQELNSSLSEVQSLAQTIEGLLGRFEPVRRGPGRPPKAPAAHLPPARKVGRPRGRPRRGPGEFRATEFILQAVKDSAGTGIRPREIVEKVVAAVPGQHVRPSALVSTILTRLKRKGEVRRRSGKWYTK